MPGKAVWRNGWARLFDGLEVVLWQEPDAEDLTRRLAPDIPGLRVIHDAEYKDISEAHIAGENVPGLVARLRGAASCARDLQATVADAELAGLREEAAPVLEAADPLGVVQDAFRGQGYGGNLKTPTITYLAATTRLLEMRHGAMPAHTVLIGPPSAGKSFAVRTALSLLPSEAYYEIDAGSPRVLIYDETDLRHRALVFSEADSLPASEDNPAASAVRNMLRSTGCATT